MIKIFSAQEREGKPREKEFVDENPGYYDKRFF